MPVFINDGYEKDGEVAPFGDFPGLKYRYRPALARAVADYFAADKASGPKAEAAAVALLGKHVVSWDAPDDSGVPAAVTPELLKKLPYRALHRMLDTVCGYGPDEQAADEKN